MPPSVNERTKALRGLLVALKDIPTINTEYDVLGYVYEYLISQFAAGAGKKSGEFFTPKEVSTVIARIVAYNLRDRETIEVFDPTAGSGSLLLSVGDTFEKEKHKKGRVKYYYQELIKGTYNMCRQNLAMRGVMPSNMMGRNGDTLGFDYPYFDDKHDDPRMTYAPVFVDAVVANPPYSQRYSPEKIKDSARFSEYGLPPAGKADFAFLLHGLYHLKSDGVQVIVLPHGVLFRNDEAEIRTQLIERGKIEAIIGLPANVFFGTGIPTTLLILKKTREERDIFFIDASKGFIKDGNKNKLRESDVQRIVDTYISKESTEKYSRLVSFSEIVENDYNLNISRYINSEPDPERYDTFGVMNGAIPKNELREKFSVIWDNFDTLYGDLFREINEDYIVLKTDDIISTINENPEVKQLRAHYGDLVDQFTREVENDLILSPETLDHTTIQFDLKDKLFDTLRDFELMDPYKAYQAFYDHWVDIELDLEILHEEGFEAARELQEITKAKKVRGKEVQVFDRWEGKIFPYVLVQEMFLKEKSETLTSLKGRNETIREEFDNYLSLLDEEDGQKVLNDAGDAFLATNVRQELDQLFEEVDTPEITALNDYLELLSSKASKDQKLDFMRTHPEVDWDAIPKNKDGTVGVSNARNYFQEVQASFEFEEDSFGYILTNVIALRDEESNNNKEIKAIETELQEETGKVLQNLTDEEIKRLLEAKWIHPMNEGLKTLLSTRLSRFETDLKETVDKYGKSLSSLEARERELNQALKNQLMELTGSSADLAGIQDFIQMLEV